MIYLSLYQQFKVLDINTNVLCMISDFRNGPGSKTGKGSYMKKVVEMRMFREHLRNN